jgi:hypothetical protein
MRIRVRENAAKCQMEVTDARAPLVPFMITHRPGYMFVSNLTVVEVIRD